MRKVIAIDFDGCLCENAYPNIGKPYWGIIAAALIEKSAGTALILWTCREGKLLEEAVEACKLWGLSFDAINDNLPEWIAAYGENPRKIGADEYWDDKAVRTPNCSKNSIFPKSWRTWILNRFINSKK